MKNVICSFLVIFFLLEIKLSVGQNFLKIDSLEKALIFTDEYQAKIELLVLISDEYLSNDPEKSLTYINDALVLSEKYNFDRGRLHSWINLAEIYQIKTDLKTSIEYSFKATELAKEMSSDSEFAQAILIMANCFTQLGEYTKSSEYSYESLKIYEKTGNQSGMCDALNAIGIIYFQQEEFEKALEYFQKSLALAYSLNDDKGIARGLNNTSNIYGRDKENIHKSIEALIMAIQINLRTGKKLWLGINYSNLASYYYQLEEYDSTFHYIYMSINTYKELNNYLDLARAYNQLSNYYLQLKNPEKFLYYSYLADSIGRDLNLKDVQFNAADNLQKFYSSVDDFEKAFYYKNIQYAIKDSLDFENSITRLSQLEVLYDLEKQEQERKIEAQRRNFIAILIIVSLISGLIVILLLLIRYRIKVRYSKLEKRKLEDELEFKNKELATNVMSLMKKNEMLSDVTNKLTKVESNAVKQETKNAISRIAMDIENSIQEKIWEEFAVRFKQVHSDFYDNLSKRFPDLTPNEQRLCAFLKLNLSTKEISSITGQSPRAIEMGRFRLRKKLGISAQDVNLISFISQI